MRSGFTVLGGGTLWYSGFNIYSWTRNSYPESTFAYYINVDSINVNLSNRTYREYAFPVSNSHFHLIVSKIMYAGCTANVQEYTKTVHKMYKRYTIDVQEMYKRCTRVIQESYESYTRGVQTARQVRATIQPANLARESIRAI